MRSRGRGGQVTAGNGQYNYTPGQGLLTNKGDQSLQSPYKTAPHMLDKEILSLAFEKVYFIQEESIVLNIDLPPFFPICCVKIGQYLNR